MISLNFFIILSDKTFPIYQSDVQKLQIFSNMKSITQKIIFAPIALDKKMFEKVLDCIHGNQLNIQKDKQIEKILDIIKYFQIPNLEQQIINDLYQNLQEYGIFTALTLSIKYSYLALYQLCVKELKKLHFQQVVINKHDLFNCGPTIFKCVVNQYLKYQPRSEENYFKQKFTQQYQESNGTKIMGNQIEIDSIFKLRPMVSKKIGKKRSLSCNDKPNFSGQPVQNLRKISQNQLQSMTRKVSSSKSKEIDQLIQLNLSIKRNSDCFQSQINVIRNKMASLSSKNSKQQNLQILQQNFERLRKIQTLHESKLQKLQYEINQLEKGKISQSTNDLSEGKEQADEMEISQIIQSLGEQESISRGDQELLLAN